MDPITEGKLTFQFDEAVSATKYDEWDFYKRTMNPSPFPKGVDFAVVETIAQPNRTWLMEVKDFRVLESPPRPSNLATLPETVAEKVEHTIEGLRRAATEATVDTESDFAQLVKQTSSFRVVLHLEEPIGPRPGLFPPNFRASVYQKLKQLLQKWDPSPLVLSLKTTPRAAVPWSVS